MIILNRIKILRKERGLTQAQLAQELNISASSVGMYEQGRREPDVNMCFRLAEYFGVSIDYMMGGRAEKSIEWKDFVERIRRDLMNFECITVDGVSLTRQELEKVIQLIEKIFIKKQ
mgnify:CR=1 FL=1